MRWYTDTGKLPGTRSPGGRRIFRVGDLLALRREPGGVGQVVLYARVSSRHQQAEGDLERQLGRLRSAAAGRTVAAECFDVASRLSDRRSGLTRALDAAARPGVSALLVTRPERLARFGTGPVERLLSRLGVTIEIVGEDAEVTDTRESELVSDMLAVVTSFSGRLYGARSARARALRAERAP
jgi:predicted site-specific integrase-resolvase